jgi:hypothetical protein
MTTDTNWLPDEAEIKKVDDLLTRLKSVAALIDKLRDTVSLANRTIYALTPERDRLREELEKIINQQEGEDHANADATETTPETKP